MGRLDFLRWPSHWFNPLQFFFLYPTFQFILNWWHEFWHVMVLIWLGGEGVVKPMLPLFFVTDITRDVVGYNAVYVRFAGGVITALFCLLFWATTTDIENKIIFASTGWGQLIYGSVEGFSYLFGNYVEMTQGAVGFWSMVIPAGAAILMSKRIWNPTGEEPV